MSTKTNNSTHPLMGTEHHKRFEKTIRGLCRRNELWKVFSDFCEMSAIALSQPFMKDAKREERYLALINSYDENERMLFPQLLSETVLALSETECDFLGELFMGLELGSHWHGQYFTPFNICKFMGAITITDIEEGLKTKEFYTVMEPCVGSGAMVIGLASALKEKGINYQRAIHVTGVDISSTAVHMAYIQLALIHIPARLYIGNSLSNKWDSVFVTPAHCMGLWDYKLKREKEAVAEVSPPDANPPVAQEAPIDLFGKVPPEIPAPPAKTPIQPSLFA